VQPNKKTGKNRTVRTTKMVKKVKKRFKQKGDCQKARCVALNYC
jgi:hypothetical protein